MRVHRGGFDRSPSLTGTRHRAAPVMNPEVRSIPAREPPRRGGDPEGADLGGADAGRDLGYIDLVGV